MDWGQQQQEGSSVKYRTVFISDLHLGSKHCKVDELSKFLDNLDCEHLYLVGDIIDGWRLQKKWYWPQSHNKILTKILKLSKRMNVTYITGNHDEFLRTFGSKNNFGKIDIVNRATHVGVDGKRYLVIHGDLFDYLMKTQFGRLVMAIGDHAYDLLINVNTLIYNIRKLFGFNHWSLSKYLKMKAKSASNFIGSFEEKMVSYCKKRNYDGVICGHIHHPVIREIDGIVYMNDGDWVENCSALVEHMDGKYEII